jgi:hypothetical protein
MPSDCTRVVKAKLRPLDREDLAETVPCNRCTDCCKKGSCGSVCNAPFRMRPKWLHMRRGSFLKASETLLSTASVLHLTHHWRLFSSLVPLLWLGESKGEGQGNNAHSQTLHRRSCRNHLNSVARPSVARRVTSLMANKFDPWICSKQGY